MRPLRWVLLLAAIAPWALLAFAQAPKKGKTTAKKAAATADLASLSESDRRALILERVADDQRKKVEQKQKEERTKALKVAARLEAQLKSAATEEKPELLYELGVTHLRIESIAPARRYFRQAAELPGDWADRAKVHLFDIALYEDRSLEDAGSVLHVADAASFGNSVTAPAMLLSPRQTPAGPLPLEAVAANLDARRVLLDFANGKSPNIAVRGADNRFWTALANWKSEFPETLEEKSDATWLVRLAELHVAAADHKTVVALAGAIVTGKGLHPTKSQKSLASFRRAQAAYQLIAAMQTGERSLKDIVADYALAIKTDKDAPWAGDALFLQGNVLWNQFQDDAAAIKLWKELLVKYPQCRLAENAAYNIGVLHQLYGEKEKAQAAFAAFRERFPDSKLLASLNPDGLAGHIKSIPRP
jgi:tetratricopeptide (TPR) repeat protein